MQAFETVAEEEIADAAFLAGLLTPTSRVVLMPLPVKVDGLATIAFCVKAEPAGHEGIRILHPVALIPHRGMIIQDLRNGVSPPLTRSRVLPLDARSAKIYRAALEDPNAFFGSWGA